MDLPKLKTPDEISRASQQVEQEYKREMMLRLVTNEKLSCSSVTHDIREVERYARNIETIADRLTREAFNK